MLVEFYSLQLQEAKSETQKDTQLTPWEFVPRFFQGG
jgi:hypothetical protein